MPPFFSGQSPIFSQQMNDPRAGLAQALIQGGLQGTPVNSPLEGVGRLASALGGAWMAKQQRAEQEAKKAAAASTLSQAIAGYNAPEIVPGPPVLDLGSGDQGDTGVGFGAGEGTAEQPTFDQTERQLTPDEKASRLVQALASNPDLAPVAANIQLTQAMAQSDAQRKAEAAAAAREQELRDKKVTVLTPEQTRAAGIDPNLYQVEVDAFGNRTYNKISDVKSEARQSQDLEEAKAGNPGAEAAPKFFDELGKLTAQDFTERRDSARDAAENLRSNRQALELLDGGIISGSGADFLLDLGRGLKRFGFDVNEDAIVNTEAFVAQRAQQVANIIKQFGAGSGLSDADREFALKIVAGDVSLDENSIRKIIKLNDIAARNALEAYNKEATILDNMDTPILPFKLAVPMPDFSEDTKKPSATVPDFGAMNRDALFSFDLESLDSVDAINAYREAIKRATQNGG